MSFAQHSSLTAAQRRARFAISAIFFINGLTLATWFSRIPAITGNLGMSNAQTGTALMAIAVGALMAFPLAGGLNGTRGSRWATLLFGLILICGLPLVGLAPSMLLLFPALFVLGFGNGGMDVSMNAQGMEIEKFYGKGIINSLHGFYSVGAFVGAGMGAGAVWLGFDPSVHLAIISVVALAGIARMRSALIPDEPDSRITGDAPVFVLPPRALWLLGVVAGCTAIGEGAMADWSGLYLHDFLNRSETVATLGFASFSLLMLIGRFAGDALVGRFGPVRIVRIGSIFASAGLAIGLAFGTAPAAIVGFGAVGIGLAVIYPLAFRAAANHPTIPRGRAVAGVATIGYTGFLFGPPVLGWIAEITTLQVALFLVAALCAVSAIYARVTQAAMEDPTAAAAPLPGAAD